MEKFEKFYGNFFKEMLEYRGLEIICDSNSYNLVSERGVEYTTTDKGVFVRHLYALRSGLNTELEDLKEVNRAEQKKFAERKKWMGFVRKPKSGKMLDLESRRFYQFLRVQ